MNEVIPVIWQKPDFCEYCRLLVQIQFQVQRRSGQGQQGTTNREGRERGKKNKIEKINKLKFNINTILLRPNLLQVYFSL